MIRDPITREAYADKARPSDLVESRRKLTRMEIIELCVRQEGRCGCGCGHRLDPFTEGVIDEHLIPLELTGSNDLKNRALYRKPCAGAKTKTDAANIAKAKRLAGETCTAPTKRPIQSRGFDKTVTKGFDGKVRPRKSPALRSDYEAVALAFAASLSHDETVSAVIAALTAERDRFAAALTKIARLRTELRGDFSMASKQSDIARAALSQHPLEKEE